MIWTLGSDPTINNSLDDPASLSLCVSQWGWKDAAGLVYQTPLIVWRLLNASRWPSLLHELALLKAQLAQVAQTASNVQVDLGSKLGVLRTRVGALEQALAPSHHY
ncbi:unnamed protein product [Phytophthora fragariaefolia]|uniref:Unnamed protein product n=1 Tax=Phytophthora fragariaefolia TaxID=1490495 RepID=A0A9W6YFT6_9STRA|nr:unnamed protein product [Phytophthora fragariaefolia]